MVLVLRNPLGAFENLPQDCSYGIRNGVSHLHSADHWVRGAAYHGHAGPSKPWQGRHLDYQAIYF